VRAHGEKIRKMVLGVAQGVGPHHAGDVEAVRAGDVDNGSLEAVRIVQKSRSA
jgi:hypothetical protein